MKQLSFGNPIGSFQQWAQDCFRQIEDASSEDIEQAVAQFSTTGSFTETRTFNASSATLADLRNVLATLISDVNKRGSKRSYAR